MIVSIETIPQDVKTVAAASTTARTVYVSQDIGNDANDGSIFRPFKTIQAGINKAELTAAFLRQVVVMISPPSGGTGYLENLVMSQQGVHLQGTAPLLRTDAVLLTGTITINLTGTTGGTSYLAGSNVVYINGLTIVSGSSDAVTFSGTVFQRLWASNSFFQSTGGSAIVVSNNGTSGGTDSTVVCYDVQLTNNTSSQPTANLTNGRLWLYGVNSVLQNNNASGHSIDQSGTTSFIADSTGITGQVNITDNTANATMTRATIASGSLAAIATPASASTGVITLAQCGLTTSATNSITGSGVVVPAIGNVKQSTGGDIVSTVTQVVLPKFPEGQTLIGAGSQAATNALLIVRNGHNKSTQTTAPTKALNANAGTGATCVLSNATDTAGLINLTTGTGVLAAGVQATITFNKAYNVAPIVVITPINTNAGANLVQVYVTTTTTTMVINFVVAGVISTSYQWSYQAIETQ